MSIYGCDFVIYRIYIGSCPYLETIFIPGQLFNHFIWTASQPVSCCLSTCIVQSECWAYITIQTLLLWKALSFLLCAGKHHWEHEQNTSKQDTNSCCCGWLHGWMELSICLWFRRNKRRLNYTNYGIHHTVQSDWALCRQAASRTTLLFFKYFIVHIPLLSSSMSVSVYRHMVGAFHVSSVHAVATTPVCLLPFGTKKQIMNIPALEPGRKPQ